MPVMLTPIRVPVIPTRVKPVRVPVISTRVTPVRVTIGRMTQVGVKPVHSSVLNTCRYLVSSYLQRFDWFLTFNAHPTAKVTLWRKASHQRIVIIIITGDF